MKGYQTPQHKLLAHSAENRNGRFKDFPCKKSIKIANKSLSAAFTSVSQESSDLSPISEISDANCSEDVSTFLLEEPSDITPGKITDSTISSADSSGAYELDGSKFASVEAEIAVNFLRNVKPDILNSVNASSQYRKLMDGMIEYVINNLQTSNLPEERDCSAQMLLAKNRMLFLCTFTFIWIIGVAVVLFFTSDIPSPYRGPKPT